jgi:hypothetical protein
MITCVVVIDGLTLLSYFTQVSLFKLVLLCLYLKSFQRTLFRFAVAKVTLLFKLPKLRAKIFIFLFVSSFRRWLYF